MSLNSKLLIIIIVIIIIIIIIIIINLHWTVKTKSGEVRDVTNLGFK